MYGVWNTSGLGILNRMYQGLASIVHVLLKMITRSVKLGTTAGCRFRRPLSLHACFIGLSKLLSDPCCIGLPVLYLGTGNLVSHFIRVLCVRQVNEQQVCRVGVPVL